MKYKSSTIVEVLTASLIVLISFLITLRIINEINKCHPVLFRDYFSMRTCRDSLLFVLAEDIDLHKNNRKTLNFDWGTISITVETVDSTTYKIIAIAKLDCALSFTQNYYISDEI